LGFICHSHVSPGSLLIAALVLTYLALATWHQSDIHEAPGVQVTLVCAALGRLLLLLGLDLGGLRLDLA
jgi:hypothetical protein